MAKFNAATAVERMEYDFTEYGGGEGVIPEPTTQAVNEFFSEARAIMKRAKELQARVQGDRAEVSDLNNEEAIEALSNLADEAGDLTNQVQDDMARAISILCGAQWVGENGSATLVGGSPTADQLKTLPFRVMQAFSTWIMEEIRPKKVAPGTKH